MKKIIKNSIKIYIGMIVGIILVQCITYADNSLTASSTNIDKTNMPNISGTTLNSALDYLYALAENVGTSCPQGQICEIDFGGMFVYETASKTYEHIVYMDPTDLSKTCYDLNTTSNVEQKTGCMKWYIYGRDNDGNYLAILDHNVKERQAWNTDTNVTQYGTNVAYEDSLVYPVVQNLTSTDTANGGSSWDTSLSPRLISAYEVADIVGKEGFTSTSGWFYLDSKNQTRTNTSQGTSNYAWLFDNLGWNDSAGNCVNYGCNYSNTLNSAAYWTETPLGTAGDSCYLWRVRRIGDLFYDGTAYLTSSGIRPVIEVSKTIFE